MLFFDVTAIDDDVVVVIPFVNLVERIVQRHHFGVLLVRGLVATAAVRTETDRR